MQGEVITVPNIAKVTEVIYTPSVSMVCSLGDAPFHAEIVIKYQPDSLLLEFMSFESWLHNLSREESTIEDLCRLIYDCLVGALGDIPIMVEVHGRTTVHAPASAIIKERGYK